MALMLSKKKGDTLPDTLTFYTLGSANGNAKRTNFDINLVNLYSKIKVTCTPTGTVNIGYVTSSMSDTPTNLGSITLGTDTDLSSFNIPANAIALTVTPDNSIAYPEYVVEFSK